MFLVGEIMSELTYLRANITVMQEKCKMFATRLKRATKLQYIPS
jgi:hypothetical protein